MMIDLSSMNKNQHDAVLWDKGALLVLAGPGSGKTRVLTYRIANILSKSPDKHFRILALTFTNRAAKEMRDRVERLVPQFMNRARITTFHSYAAELLQQHGSHIDIRPDFQILSDDVDREAILDGTLNKLRKNSSVNIPDHFEASSLLPFLNRLLEQCIPVNAVEELLQRSQPETSKELALVYATYKESLAEENMLDFPSLIAETLEIFDKFPILAQRIRKVYTHILVDEFQDTNSSQYRMLNKVLAPDSSNLFVVADDDQIIYQWNGADPKRLYELINDYSASVLQLPENYRCPAEIVEIANSLIANNISRNPDKKPLISVKSQNNSKVIEMYKFASLDDEVTWIANQILEKNHEERDKCAILARANKLLEAMGAKLAELNIPSYFAVRKNEFKSAPMCMLHAVLRLANTQTDKKTLAKLCKAFEELEGIQLSVSKIISRASASGQDFLRAWIAETQESGRIESDTLELISIGIKPLLSSLNYSIFSDKLLQWANKRQESQQIDAYTFNEFENEIIVWKEIHSEILKKFSGEDVSLHQFLRELDLTSKTPQKEKGAVPCFTIHASKGMEFGHVYLMGMVEDQLPSWAAVKKGADSLQMQEERRNCFVAITRAQEKLTLTCAEKVFGWNKDPSRFLREMGFCFENSK